MSLKIIDKSQYCKMGQELCETTCKGKGCKHIFVDVKTQSSDNDTNMVEYIPTSKRYVRACFNVNDCGYALCRDCYTKILLEDSNDTDERRRKRRTSN